LQKTVSVRINIEFLHSNITGSKLFITPADGVAKKRLDELLWYAIVLF